MKFPHLDEAEEPDWDLGGAIYLLYLAPELWIHRRVESVAFFDVWSMRRRVSVGFEIPDEDVTGVEKVDVVPLALLNKDVLVDFDLVGSKASRDQLMGRIRNSRKGRT